MLCTAMVFTPGKTVEDMRASIKMTRSMVLEHIIGLTVAYTRVNGQTESRMEEVNTPMKVR